MAIVNNSFQMSQMIQKMTSSDKDFRFMATNDLLNELQNDSIKLDEDAERKILKALLILLRDNNAEVQNLAVKCLGPFVNRIKETLAENTVETLCDNILSTDEVLKETSSIGLKTVISEISIDSKSLVTAICNKITSKLVIALTLNNCSVQIDVLDIFSDLIFRFGYALSFSYPTLKNSLIPHLKTQRNSISKRAINCLAGITITCDDKIFKEIIDHVIGELDRPLSTNQAKVFLNCLTSICKHSGGRIRSYVDTIVTLNKKFIDTQDDELIEACLLMFEIFVRRCPQEMNSHLSKVIAVCIKYISYDPNYNYDDNNDEDMEMDNDVDEYNAEDDYEEFSDEDDMSWKVRRAAAKTLETIILNRLDLLEDFYRVISPIIIQQFKEREENVKVDIFNTYISLLRQTKALVVNSENNEKFRHILRNQIPSIVRSLDRQLKEKSIKTRQCCFSLLSELVQILPNALADPINEADEEKNYLNNIIPGILYSLNSKNSSSSMKIETLSFLNLLFKNHHPQVFQNYLSALITEIRKAVKDDFYRISSEALVVLTELVQIIEPNLNESSIENDSLATSSLMTSSLSYLDTLYSITFEKLKTSDVDIEVKENAIICMAQIVCTFGDFMSETQLQQAFAVFLERLRNEVTRLACVKALIKITNVDFRKPLRMDPIFPEAFSVLAHFLKQNKRSIKIHTLILIDKICKNYSDYLSMEINEKIINQIVPLISEADLYVSQLSLAALTSMILSHKAFIAAIPQRIIPEALVLIRSPLLQGSTLNSMLDFFCAIVRSSFPGLGYEELVDRLTQIVTQSQTFLYKQAYFSISKCIAAISLLTENAINLVERLIQQVKNPSIMGVTHNESVQLYSLLTIAEIGKSINLEQLEQPLQEALINLFISSHEEVKSAASICLGSISMGNLERNIPFILKEINKNSTRPYLFLNALKEIIVCLSNDHTKIKHIESQLNCISQLLLKYADCDEEITRYIVSECLGKLTLLKPDYFLPILIEYLDRKHSINTRETVITSIRFVIAEYNENRSGEKHNDEQWLPMLKQFIQAFIETLSDSDIVLRRVAFITLNSILHNRASLITEFLGEVFPILYKETRPKPEYIREVEMGPFKHTVDDGLDLRKAVFECMYTLLDSCLDKVEIFEYLNNVESGLKDTYDIKMLTFLILIRLSDLCPSAILQHLESIVGLLKETCFAKLKSNSVKQEYEKQDELRRSAIRAFVAIYRIRDADKNSYANDLMNSINSHHELKLLHESVIENNKMSKKLQPSMEVDLS
ncbi:Cullin-associated Nedd8-dissociated protein 1 [Sarcoptes scabiei]|uniref:Cullin-associated Nedd8-dissociated protein 1 n=2 Tax=Sarcoptes scabiei TaxID=52283 RepID=A0A834VEG0_SARSC|nr:Cullin-associated Nedd8-dissociated protein 1 [Sarcoptes scabiei]